MKIYTLQEFAAIVRFTPETVRLEVKKRGNVGSKKCGQWRFTDDDINRFLEGDTCQSKSEATPITLTSKSTGSGFDSLRKLATES